MTTSRRPVATLARQLAMAPTVWLLHFVAVYVTAALACGRWQSAGVEAGPVVLGLTIVALAALATGIHPRGRLGVSPEVRRGLADVPSVASAPFLSALQLLLAGVSGLGVVFVAAGVGAVGVCR